MHHTDGHEPASTTPRSSREGGARAHSPWTAPRVRKKNKSGCGDAALGDVEEELPLPEEPVKRKGGWGGMRGCGAAPAPPAGALPRQMGRTLPCSVSRISGIMRAGHERRGFEPSLGAAVAVAGGCIEQDVGAARAPACLRPPMLRPGVCLPSLQRAHLLPRESSTPFSVTRQQRATTARAGLRRSRAAAAAPLAPLQTARRTAASPRARRCRHARAPLHSAASARLARSRASSAARPGSSRYDGALLAWAGSGCSLAQGCAMTGRVHSDG